MAYVSGQDPTGLDVSREGSVIRLTLDRPERRNALSHALIERLAGELTDIAGDTSARVVVLAARGSVFCSGHDLGELSGRSEDEFRELFASCARMMLQLRRLPQPVVARVQGTATAAGCQLVAACDLAVASDTATFATPGVKIGLFCTTPMVPLVRAVPAKAALEMLLTGDPISAERALAMGLINRVVPEVDLDDAIGQLTDAIKAMSPTAIELGKQAFYELLERDESGAYERAVDVMTANALLPDAREGVAAFLGKRRPVWTGLAVGPNRANPGSEHT